MREEVNDCAQEAGSYEGAFGEELSERDQSLYGGVSDAGLHERLVKKPGPDLKRKHARSGNGRKR